MDLAGHDEVGSLGLLGSRSLLALGGRLIGLGSARGDPKDRHNG